MNRLKETKYLKFFGFLITITTTFLIQARENFKGFIYGDPFDGRLMIVLHEHWWHFFNGNRSLLDTYFFYPFDRALGFSDSFLIQGFIYSGFRWGGFDLLESWKYTTLAILLISNIGLALLANQTIQKYFLQLLLILVIGNGFTFFVFLNMSPNVASYGLVSYLAYFIAALLSSKASHFKKNFSFFGIGLTLPLLLLSAWYAAFFSVLFILIYFFIYLIFNFNSLGKIKLLYLETLSIVSKKTKLISLSVFFSLLYLWIYIYFPALSEVRRTSSEVQKFLIRPEQLMNGSALGGGVLKNIYSSLGFSDFDNLYQERVGITISIFTLWITTGLIILFSRKAKLEACDSKLWLAGTLQLLLFLQINDFSLFQSIWEIFTPLKAIRVSTRYLVLFSSLIIFITFRFIDKWLSSQFKYLKLKRFGITAVIVIAFMDQLRFTSPKWMREDYISNDFSEITAQAKTYCDAFYLNSEVKAWWDDQLTAMIMSAEYNFPTVNGYSGGYPEDYPLQQWNSKTVFIEVVKWLSNRDALQETCLIRRNSVDKLNTDVIFDTISGFNPLEKNNTDVWWWSSQPRAEFSIINLSNRKIEKILTARVQIPPCQDSQLLSIRNTSSNNYQTISLNKKSKKFTMPIIIEPLSQVTIEITSSFATCNLESDSRILYFSIKNPELKVGRLGLEPRTDGL